MLSEYQLHGCRAFYPPPETTERHGTTHSAMAPMTEQAARPLWKAVSFPVSVPLTPSFQRVDCSSHHQCADRLVGSNR